MFVVVVVVVVVRARSSRFLREKRKVSRGGE